MNNFLKPKPLSRIHLWCKVYHAYWISASSIAYMYMYIKKAKVTVILLLQNHCKTYKYILNFMLVIKLFILFTSAFYSGTNLTRNTNTNLENPIEFAALSINNLLAM